MHALRPNGTVLDPADIECLVEAFQSALQVTAGEGAAGIMTKHDAVACLSRHDWDLRRTLPAMESAAVQDLIRARRSGWLTQGEFSAELEQVLQDSAVGVDTSASGGGAAGGEEAAESGKGCGVTLGTGASKPSNSESKGAAGGEESSSTEGGSGRDEPGTGDRSPADVDMKETEEKRDLVELRLRVWQEGGEKIVVARVRPDAVDLAAHKGLVELPEELRRCAGRVRELRVESGRMNALPAWVGELSALQTLNLSWCTGLGALPVQIGALTAL